MIDESVTCLHRRRILPFAMLLIPVIQSALFPTRATNWPNPDIWARATLHQLGQQMETESSLKGCKRLHRVVILPQLRKMVVFASMNSRGIRQPHPIFWCSHLVVLCWGLLAFGVIVEILVKKFAGQGSIRVSICIASFKRVVSDLHSE